MLNYAILLAAFTAFVNCSSEMNFGIMTIKFILNHYHDQLIVLEPQFGENIHKYLMDLETRALAVSDALATCVHEGVLPIEEKLVQEVKEALEKETNIILETLATVDHLGAAEVDSLWTSVSQEGTFREEMNAMIMALKSDVLQQLEEFKVNISERCSSFAVASSTQAQEN